MNGDIQRVLDCWFADAESSEATLRDRMAFWFGAGGAQHQAARDEEMRRQFGTQIERASRGELDHWTATPAGRLALILVIDQFRRNVHRGTPAAFACDDKALALVRDGMRAGADTALGHLQRIFFYMPLQHAEDIAAQEQSVRVFETLARTGPAALQAMLSGSLDYARLHRDIVQRFGRFPHRNRMLGRESTPEELAYLEADAPDFGQSAQR